MCVIKEFCCGCTLRHGAIAASVINLIEAVTIIKGAIQFLNYIENPYITVSEKKSFSSRKKLLRTLVTREQGWQRGMEDCKDCKDLRKIYGGIFLAYGLISIVTFFCLVVGITKSSAGFIMSWLMGWMTNIVISCILILVSVIMMEFVAVAGRFGILSHELLAIAALLGTAFYKIVTVVSLIHIAFYIYLWIVVLNYYREVRDDPFAYTSVVKA